MVGKKGKKFRQGSPPPFSGNTRKKTFFFFRRVSLLYIPLKGNFNRNDVWARAPDFFASFGIALSGEHKREYNW